MGFHCMPYCISKNFGLSRLIFVAMIIYYLFTHCDLKFDFDKFCSSAADCSDLKLANVNIDIIGSSLATYSSNCKIFGKEFLDWTLQSFKAHYIMCISVVGADVIIKRFFNAIPFVQRPEAFIPAIKFAILPFNDDRQGPGEETIDGSIKEDEYIEFPYDGEYNTYGLLYKPQTECRVNAQRHPYVIIASHNMGSAAFKERELCEKLAEKTGCYVMTYEYAGYNLVKGTPCEDRAIKCINAAYDYLTDKEFRKDSDKSNRKLCKQFGDKNKVDLPVFEKKNVFLYGHSVGSGPTFALAATKGEDELAGVFICGGLASGGRVLLKNDFLCRMLYSIDPFDNLALVESGKYNHKTFIYHHKEDNEISYEHNAKLMIEALTKKNVQVEKEIAVTSMDPNFQKRLEELEIEKKSFERQI